MAISHRLQSLLPVVAVLVRLHRRRPPLSLSSTAVVRQYVKIPHLRILPITSADFLCKIYLQFTSCNIHILPLSNTETQLHIVLYVSYFA